MPLATNTADRPVRGRNGEALFTVPGSGTSNNELLPNGFHHIGSERCGELFSFPFEKREAARETDDLALSVTTVAERPP